MKLTHTFFNPCYQNFIVRILYKQIDNRIPIHILYMYHKKTPKFFLCFHNICKQSLFAFSFNYEFQHMVWIKPIKSIILLMKRRFIFLMSLFRNCPIIFLIIVGIILQLFLFQFFDIFEFLLISHMHCFKRSILLSLSSLLLAENTIC